MNFKQIFAIAEKELKLSLRFKYGYILKELINPLKFLIFFGLLYSSFFTIGAKNLGGVTKENFISFLLIGALIYGFFSSAFNTVSYRFTLEKFWQTIQALLIAPLNMLRVLIGITISEMVRVSVVFLIFLLIINLLSPIKILYLLIGIVIIFLILIGTLGVAFIGGAFALSNENFIPLFTYFIWGWTFFSCFYYPITVIPSMIRPLAYINPVYHGVTLIRELWVSGSSDFFVLRFSFVLLFAVITPLIGVLIFNKIIKKVGITGY